MPGVKKINPDTAPEEVKKAIADHLAKGHRLTNEKLTLLHSVPAFYAIEVGSYDLDDELASIIGKRAADIYEYAISSANDCIVCTVYFKKLLDSEGIDINNFQFTKGNTQAMAEAVADGAKQAGADVDLIEASEFDTSSVGNYDALAFGCPAMGAEQLDDSVFELMFSAVEGSLNGKKVGLFGNYGWGDGQWMRDWQDRVNADGANQVQDGVIANNAPDDAALAECNALGAALA